VRFKILLSRVPVLNEPVQAFLGVLEAVVKARERLIRRSISRYVPNSNPRAVCSTEMRGIELFQKYCVICNSVFYNASLCALCS